MGITKKQKEVFDYIAEYCHVNGHSPTQKEIKEHFQLKSFGSVQKYIHYLTRAGYLQSENWNARRGLTPTLEKTKNASNKTATPVDNNTEIPLLGMVAAGNPIEALENPSETIAIPPTMLGKAGNYFALKVQGDSMIDEGICDADIIICRQQKTAHNGQTVVAVIDGEATVKNYYTKNNTIELHPANAKYSPIVLSGGDFNLAGVLIGLIRHYA